MKRILIIFLALAYTFSYADAKEIKGTVKDTEGNAISGVVVSDGLLTTVTDSKGRFEIDPDQDSRFIFISTPAGYSSSTSAGNESYFMAIGRNAKKSYDFIVRKKEKDDTRHNLIAFADPQISEADELPQLEEQTKAMGEFVKSMDSDETFAICLGDLVGWDHRIYPGIKKAFDQVGIPMRIVMGNHDMTCWGNQFEGSAKDFEDAFGPAWYSFNVGKVHYVVLNNNFFIGRDWFYIGYLEQRQLRWLERDLSYVPAGSTVVVSVHIPTTLWESDREAFSYNDISEIMSNKKALYERLAPYKAIILSGHTHTSMNQIITPDLMEQNISGLCGAWWCGPYCIDGTPIGWKAIEFNGDKVTWQFKSSGKPLDHQMKVYVDDDEYKGYTVANIWDYDPMWKVEYFEDGVKVCDMERFKGYDPAAKNYYSPATGKFKREWVCAYPTWNMFRASLSPDAKVIEVRVTDRFGRVYRQEINR